MAHLFAKVSEQEIVAINEEAFFYPFDLVNTKTTIPLRVGEEGIYILLVLNCVGLPLACSTSVLNAFILLLSRTIIFF